MRRFEWAATALMLLAAAPAWAQDAVAVLTEIQARKGQVQVRTGSEADWVTPKPLQALRAGDQVRVQGDGRAVLVFTGGRGNQVVTQSNSPFKVEAKGDPAVTDRAKSVLNNVTNFLIGQQREKTYQSLSVRSLPRPDILAPRETMVLADGPITFEWTGSEQQRYAVRVLQEPAQPSARAAPTVVWQKVDVDRKPVVYDGPPLVPGAKYTFQLETKMGAKLNAPFEVLSAAASRRVRDELAVLTPESARDYPPSTLVLMRAGLLFQERLYLDARRELTAGIARHPDEATLHLLLGHVYARTGLTQLADREFDEAEALASGR